MKAFLKSCLIMTLGGFLLQGAFSLYLSNKTATMAADRAAYEQAQDAFRTMKARGLVRQNPARKAVRERFQVIGQAYLRNPCDPALKQRYTAAYTDFAALDASYILPGASGDDPERVTFGDVTLHVGQIIDADIQDDLIKRSRTANGAPALLFQGNSGAASLEQLSKIMQRAEGGGDVRAGDFMDGRGGVSQRPC